jgi:predicted lipid carrier protein YhbT
MPKRDANVLQVLIGQMAKRSDTDSVFSKALGVLGHAELIEPLRNLLHCGASPTHLAMLRWNTYPNRRF